MKKNRIKTNSNSNTNTNNKNNVSKNFNNSKVSFRNNQQKQEDKLNNNNRNKKNTIQKTTPKSKENKIKQNSLLKEIKKDNIKENNKKEINKGKKEDTREKYKKINYDLSLTNKDLNVLITSLNFKGKNSSKSNKNISLKHNSFNEQSILKSLTNKRNDLFSELSKINEQKSYLKDESLNNIKFPNNMIRRTQIRLIKHLGQSKESLLDKVSSINQEIYQINVNKKNNSNIKEYSKEDYSEDLRKEFIFNNMNKWNKPKSNIRKRIKYSDFQKSKIKSISESSQIPEEDKKVKNNEKVSKEERHKSFINNLIQNNKNKGYLYKRMASSFDEKEKIYITEGIKSKISDIKKDNKLDMNYNNLKRKINNLEKLDNLQKMWKERSELLPKYVSPFYKKAINTEENEKKEEKDKIERKRVLYELKQNYGKEKVNLPKISFLLKKEWDKKDIKFNLNKSKGFKNIIHNNINIKVIQLKNKNKSFSKKENPKNNSTPEIHKNLKLNSLILRNNIKIKDYHSYINNINKLNFNNNISKDSFHNNIEEIKSKKISKIKIVNNKDKDINNIKYKVEMMEDKYKRGKELLKLKGGYIHNEDLGEEINELLINSIKNKLDLVEMQNQ